MPDMMVDKAMCVNRARTLAFFLLTLLVAASIGLLLGAKPAHAATTFTVNRTADTRDANLSDARCDANASASGNQCTLRAAIQEANDTAGADLIRFNIVSAASVKTISPASALPTIRESVTINGYTQDGASPNTLAQGDDAVLKVQLNGTKAGTFSDGLRIEASNSTIKGLVINRFAENGVLISHSGATGNEVLGNFIGTDASGTADLGNTLGGVSISAPDNTIGGTTSGARNIISGNDLAGFLIFNGEATGNEILGNYIGTDKNGTNALGNSTDGVDISRNADANTVGGTAGGAGNVISGNGAAGVEIRDGVRDNEVLGNLIGTNASGNAALGNSTDGVVISDVLGNTVGGTASGAGNVISGNGGNGVEMRDSAASNDVLGNFIGTDSEGTQDLGNGIDGVSIFNASNNTVGGTASGARNIISGNQDDGVKMRDGSHLNGVEGNFIGTDATGNVALPNNGDGVEIRDAFSNTIGGTVSGARNIISANLGDGVVLQNTGATGNKVQGNFIGTGANGTTALGNDDGVAIASGNDSTIGSAIGSTAGGNRIANNDKSGVFVGGSLAVGNRILSNSIFSNGGLGIDLRSDGVTANDTDDPDAPNSNNHVQNFPVITSATRSIITNVTTITGTLNSNPSQTYTIQCFVAAPDPSGHGEGQRFLGQTTATTNATGDGSFTCPPAKVAVGQAVTATATNTSGTASGTSIGDTSEFSLNRTVVSGP